MQRNNSGPQQSTLHFSKFESKCIGNHSCADLECARLADQFRAMPIDERIKAVRFMLLTLTAYPASPNTLQLCTGRSPTTNARTFLAIEGSRMCRYCFSATVQLSPRPISKHAAAVASCSRVAHYSPACSIRRLSMFSIQTKAVLNYLKTTPAKIQWSVRLVVVLQKVDHASGFSGALRDNICMKKTSLDTMFYVHS